MRVLALTSSLIVLIAVTGCFTKRTLVPEPINGEIPVPPSRQTAPAMTQGIQSRPPLMLPHATAEGFLTARLKESGLPGLPRNASGTLEASWKIPSTPGQAPAMQTFRFVRTGDQNPYIYTLDQTQQAPGWRIIRAFQADSAGKVLKQFPVE